MVHEHPGVYSSYDASSVIGGKKTARILGAAAVSTTGTANEVVTLTSYAEGVSAFGEDAEGTVGMAALHPDINFYAVERVSDVVVAAVERAMAEEVRPENLRFIVGDAKTLTEWFPPHTFDCIYLNFSDPWPKAGHYKRRLTYRAFLELYKSLLKEGGVLRLKTDNAGLFDFSLGEFEAAGMDVVKCSRDLHASPFAEGNVMTEYETNFTAKGMPIYFAEVRVK